MTESNKTLMFLGLGLLAIVLGIEPWRGGAAPPKVTSEQGKDLFPALDAAISDEKAQGFPVKEMDIAQYDADTSTLKRFSVAELGGRWVLPSKQNYPADAREHLAAAASALSNLQILSVASDKRQDHELYGVVEPPKEEELGRKGVGMRVTLKGDEGKTLADGIIGLAVRNSPGQRYVRRAGQDPVYIVDLSPDKFSTKFDDWIEKNILKMSSAFDLKNVTIHDYSTSLARAGFNLIVNRTERSDAVLAFDPVKHSWELAELIDHEGKNRKPYQLKEDEELNLDNVNALKTALGDLKIVDVDHKPEILSKNLKTEQDLYKEDDQSIQALSELGFYPVMKKPEGDKDPTIDIVSTEGEVICTLNDGVEYVLRFGHGIVPEKGADDGKAADEEATAEKKDSDAKDGEPAKAKSNSLKPNRYVLVTARYNPDVIAKPKLEPLPDAKSPEPATDDKAKEEKAKDDKSSADKPKAEAKDAAEAKPQADKEAPAAEDKVDDAAKDEHRKMIEKENEQRQKAYDDQVAKAKDRVKDLNDRFADWFYVVSDDVYRKIRLGHGDLVRVKKKAPEGEKLPDLDALKSLPDSQ